MTGLYKWSFSKRSRHGCAEHWRPADLCGRTEKKICIHTHGHFLFLFVQVIQTVSTQRQKRSFDILRQKFRVFQTARQRDRNWSPHCWLTRQQKQMCDELKGYSLLENLLKFHFKQKKTKQNIKKTHWWLKLQFRPKRLAGFKLPSSIHRVVGQFCNLKFWAWRKRWWFVFMPPMSETQLIWADVGLNCGHTHRRHRNCTHGTFL